MTTITGQENSKHFNTTKFDIDRLQESLFRFFQIAQALFLTWTLGGAWYVMDNLTFKLTAISFENIDINQSLKRWTNQGRIQDFP